MPLPVSVRISVRFFVMLAVACTMPGCQSQQETETNAEADAISKITMHDRLRLTLADADAAGIHLFDLKKLRADIVTLKETEPELAGLLLADLDRVEALPKTSVRERAAIGKEMYARFRKPLQ